MKFIKACSAFFLLSFLFASCMDNVEDLFNNGTLEPNSSSVSNNENQNNARALLYEEVANTVWFASNEYRFDFPEDKDKKIVYLNYMPDGINTERWIQLTAEENGITKAKIIYSTNIREIGKTSEVSFYKESDGNVYFECDFLSATGMQIAADNSASFFDYEKVPALKSDYLSNFAGEYTLSNGWKLKIGAKLSISKDESHYWFANVLATEYDEKTKTYDLLLAHTSQKGAAGSTSPGITGNEPFVTKQGLFWNHCTLTEISGGVWNVKWSSDWYDSPAEALDAALDMDDTFNGPTETKMHYVFNFYFGNPVREDPNDEKSNLKVERGEWIGDYKEDSDVAKTWTWAEIKSHIPSYTIPEDKTEDYWWYSSNSITWKEDSFIRKLDDNPGLILESYDIYLALKDKPKTVDVYVQEGTYSNGSIEVIVTKSSITYDGKEYQIKNGVKWTDGKNGEPLSYAYLLSDGTQNYAFNIWWYTNNNFAYVKIRAPKKYSKEELPSSYDYLIMNGFTKPANFIRQ